MATFLRKWNIWARSAKLAWNSSAVTTQKPASDKADEARAIADDQQEGAGQLDEDRDRQQEADRAMLLHQEDRSRRNR